MTGPRVHDRLRVVVPPTRLAERRWVLDVVLREFLGLPYRLVVGPVDAWRFEAPDGTARFEVADVFLPAADRAWLDPATVPGTARTVPVPADWNDERRLPASLPSAWDDGRPATRLLHRADGVQRCGIDLLGGAFFMLSRYEEAVPGPRDAHGRVRAADALAGRAGFLHRPIVDEYAEVLWSGLRRLVPGLVRRRRGYRLLLSHDVDRPLAVPPGTPGSAVLRACARDLRRGAVRTGLARAVAFAETKLGRHAHDPFNTFDLLMDVAESAGVRTAFYVMAGASDPRHDPGFDLGHPFVAEVAVRAAERGHELGFHPSYGAHDDDETFRAERRTFRRWLDAHRAEAAAYGGRQHFLRFANPDTWRRWHAGGAAYDATLGFADQPGFRCGTGREYPVFDLRRREPLALRERPLVAMDTTLFAYRRLDEDRALRLVEGLAEQCRTFGSDFSLLVHNSTLATPARRRWYRDAVRLAA